MMNLRKQNLLTLFAVALVMAICLTGCLTIGPRVKTEVVILRPGDPLRVTTQVKVKGQSVETGANIEADIGGWVAMPPEHFKQLIEDAKRGIGKP